MRRSIAKTMMVTAAFGGSLAISTAACAQDAAPAIAAAAPSEAMQDLLDYARGQNSTGFLIIQGGRTLIERNWPAPAGDRQFAIFAYGRSKDGALLEDVASQQKSFVSVLIGVGIDKGLIDVSKPVSDYIGTGWSHASRAREARIRVIDVLTMSSGLDESFKYRAPPGTTFFYNTAVYAISKHVLTAASRMSLEDVTRQWLTEPLGMTDTGWRQRPAALAGVGNPTGLVTTPRDTAAFGAMILHHGVAENGTRILSEASLKAMFARSPANPAYGRLWWLNGSDHTMRAQGARMPGPLFADAPADMVAALGFLDRRLYVVPSLDLVVVRTGADAPDPEFDDHLWQRLMRVVSKS